MPLRAWSFACMQKCYSQVLYSKSLLDKGGNVSLHGEGLVLEGDILEEPLGDLLSQAWLRRWGRFIQCGVQKPVEKVHKDSLTSGCQIKGGKKNNLW